MKQASPTDQAVRCLAMHGATFFRRKMTRLRGENQRQRRKRDMRRSYVAHGGVLAVEKGLRLAEERANGVEGLGARSGKTGAQRLCSRCNLPGHDVRWMPEN